VGGVGGAIGVSRDSRRVIERTYSPEVVDKDVEDTQDQDKENGRELGLETNNNHDTSNESKQTNEYSPDVPFTSKDETNEQEDEQDTSSKLNVHLAVLFIKLRQSSWGKSLANPAVTENHKKTTNNRQVTEEEVQIKDETVTESLGDNYANEADNSIFRVLADYNENG
jgi:hypothetical protein